VKLSIPLLVMSLVGCGSGPPEQVNLSRTPDGRLCQRAHSSTVDSLTDIFTSAGKDMPTWVSKDAYVEKCVSMGFDESQLRCLDPKLAGADPAGCKETMAAVKAKSDELTKWFADQSGIGKKEGAK